MKKLLVTALLLISSLSSAGQFLKEVEDTLVSAAAIEDFQAVSVGDKKSEISLLARLTMVYVGTAAGMSNVMLNLIDSGPTQGDYVNTYVYNLGLIVGTISNLKLQKTSTPKQYILSYKATTLQTTDDGEFAEVNASKRLKIKLSRNGLLSSVQEIN